MSDKFPLGVDTDEYFWIFNLILIEGWNVDSFMGVTPHYRGKLSRLDAAQKLNRERMKAEFKIYVYLANFNPKGCMANMVVSPKVYHQQVLIGFRYLFYRLFYQHELQQFLNDLTEIQLLHLHIDLKGNPCY